MSIDLIKAEPELLLKKTKELILAKELDNLTPLVSLFEERGRTLTLNDYYPMTPMYKCERPKELTLQCGRQLSKSFTLVEIVILLGSMLPHFHQMIIQPRYDQKERFNSMVFAPLLRGFKLFDSVIDKKAANSVNMKTFKNGNTVILEHSFNSPDRVRGASGIASIYLDEAQDLNPEFIPVIEACMDAVIDYGFKINTGTPKHTGTALTRAFMRSSQGEPCIKCPACNHYNIASETQHLFKMIGRNGCVCYHCGKHLPVRDMFYLHAYPSRIDFHAGYHIPQIIMPIHEEHPQKWSTLLSRRETWSKSRFYNEVLGIVCDDVIKLITMNDIMKARNSYNNDFSQVQDRLRYYSLVTMGIDWGGGGSSGLSLTAVSIAGHQNSTSVSDVLYLQKLPAGMKPEEEVDYLASMARQLNVDFIAHDYTGAGNIREALFTSRHPDLDSKLYPVSYAYRPSAQLVQYVDGPTRSANMVDKTKSLVFTCTAIRLGYLTLPQFNAQDSMAPQLDFLNLIENRREVTKGSDIYLIEKIADSSDDAAHAVNIGYICICDVTGDYPAFNVNTKYNFDTETMEKHFYGPKPQES